MARNKIVPGPRDREYGEGPNIDSNNIRPFKRVKKKKPTNRSKLELASTKGANQITRFGKSGHMLIPGSGGAKYDVVPIIDPTKKSKKNKRKNKKYTA